MEFFCGKCFSWSLKWNWWLIELFLLLWLIKGFLCAGCGRCSSFCCAVPNRGIRSFGRTSWIWGIWTWIGLLCRFYWKNLDGIRNQGQIDKTVIFVFNRLIQSTATTTVLQISWLEIRKALGKWETVHWPKDTTLLFSLVRLITKRNT